jgi:hypothetical protein
MKKTKTLFEQIPIAVVKQTLEELQRKQEIEKPKANSSVRLTSLVRPTCRTGISK